MTEKKAIKTMPPAANFALGGLSGCIATAATHPIDLVKTRMQLVAADGHRMSSIQTGVSVFKNEGFSGLYKGLSAGLLRQVTYTTTRLGIYNSLSNHFMPKDGTNVPFWQKAAIGIVAGGCGAMVGTPGDLALIRMMADGRLPVEKRRNYKNVGDALVKVIKSEGVLGMWRGCTPTVVRAMALNAAQLGGYSQSKELLLSTGMLKDGFWCHFTASFIAGFLATVVSIPADLLKTRYQNMRVVNGVPEYTGVINVLTKTVKAEGVLALWKGFMPYFLRLARIPALDEALASPVFPRTRQCQSF